MKKVLITGANKGIGLELSRQMAQMGFYVYLGSRNLNNGLEAVKTLNNEGLKNVEAVKLDVTQQDSIDEARAVIGKKTEVLDVWLHWFSTFIILFVKSLYRKKRSY